jgi:hypothetical protein
VAATVRFCGGWFEKTPGKWFSSGIWSIGRVLNGSQEPKSRWTRKIG